MRTRLFAPDPGWENLREQAEFTGWDRDGSYAEPMTARADFAFVVVEALRTPDRWVTLGRSIRILSLRGHRLVTLSDAPSHYLHPFPS